MEWVVPTIRKEGGEPSPAQLRIIRNCGTDLAWKHMFVTPATRNEPPSERPHKNNTSTRVYCKTDLVPLRNRHNEADTKTEEWLSCYVNNYKKI